MRVVGLPISLNGPGKNVGGIKLSLDGLERIFVSGQSHERRRVVAGSNDLAFDVGEVGFDGLSTQTNSHHTTVGVNFLGNLATVVSCNDGLVGRDQTNSVASGHLTGRVAHRDHRTDAPGLEQLHRGNLDGGA